VEVKLWKIQAVFSVWRVYVLKLQNEQLAAELHHLKENLPTKKIHNMKKAELVEEAVRELRMTRIQAQDHTAPELKELLRREKRQEEQSLDPLCQIPKGLGKMLKSDLQAEMKFRGLPFTPKTNCATMQLDIRKQVKDLTGELNSQSAPATQTSTSAGSRTRTGQEAGIGPDWMNVDSSHHK
jgi:hypothetical protein